MFFIGPSIKSQGRAEFHPHDHGPIVTVGTVCCAHCGRLWHLAPGSGRKRGFCLRCKGVTCGSEMCDTVCNGGVDQLLDNLEAGLPFDQAMQFRPVRVAFNNLP